MLAVRFLLFGTFLSSLFIYTKAPPVPTTLPARIWSDFWLFRLILNIFCYASIVIPSYVLINYLKKSEKIKKARGGCFSCLKACVIGNNDIDVQLTEKSSSIASGKRKGCVLLICAIGLQVSYLTWGLIQERIMTQKYGSAAGIGGEKFQNSQFLVFVNRLLAFVVSGIVILSSKQPRHGCPLYKFSYASFSNIMSSWFQYEALKFVSFPTQVLGKACKVIPVMFMGKIVSGNKYQMYEWLTAAMLSVGISFFLLGQGNDHVTSSSSDVEDMYGNGVVIFSGFILMIGYMMFDSFTSNWQGELFKVHHMSSTQMMFGVNLFSCIFTAISLLEQGGFFEASAFMLRHSEFAFHTIILSLCSAAGQLFIFFTISQFGAVIFTIIMTLRQAFAILLSCMIYGHPISIPGFLGIFIIFLALFLRIYAKSRTSKQRQTTSDKK